MKLLDRFKSKFERIGKKNEAKPSEASDSAPAVETRPKALSVGSGMQVKESDAAHRILARVLITEKSAVLAAGKKYVFAVAPKATKIQVKQAIKEVYGVLPAQINIVSMKGKRVRFGRFLGQRKDWKKAIVTLPEGKTLPIYE